MIMLIAKILLMLISKTVVILIATDSGQLGRKNLYYVDGDYCYNDYSYYDGDYDDEC